MRESKFLKYGYLLILSVAVILILALLLKRENVPSLQTTETASEPAAMVPQSTGNQAIETEREKWEKGYDLPIDERERREAEADCKEVMEQTAFFYQKAEKGIAVNVVLDISTVDGMVEKLKEIGKPVISSYVYANMENFHVMEDFLRNASEGNRSDVILYRIYEDGGIGREKYCFDGTDLYLLAARGTWNEKSGAVNTYTTYDRIREWTYTEKGWFCYKLCVPEPPEVSELVDGSRMIRVRPMPEEYVNYSETYLLPISYQGNNLLCSDWDTEHLEHLDYNGLYEFLYGIKYQKRFDGEAYEDGIPKEEFERLIMEYIPVSQEQIERYAAFDPENQSYFWARLGCFNYAPNYFGTSVPEVTEIKNNGDGTLTLTVDAVCEMFFGDDALMTHELEIEVHEDGSWRYLRNKILGDGLAQIPPYQYRIVNE